MNSLSIAVAVAALVASSGLIGLILQRVLPESYTSDRSRDMIGGVVGLTTLLLALVLGLLIWTAYGVTTLQQNGLQTIAARSLEFDLEMRHYGREADPARSLLRRDLDWALEQFWGDGTANADAYEASYKVMGDMNVFFDSLDPKQPAQQNLLSAARANYGFIGEQRLLMSLQATTPVSWPLIYTVTAWSCMLFFGMGLLSRLGVLPLIMMLAGAAAISSAIFLILEFNRPYTGAFRVSPEPLEQAIVQLGLPSASTDAKK